MLRREDSNKILKGIKAVVFAGALSLSCPMNVEAQEVVYEQQEATNDYPSPLVIFMNVTGGSIALLGLITLITIGEEALINYELKHNPLPKIFAGKLENGNQDDIKEAVKILKLTNGINNN